MLPAKEHVEHIEALLLDPDVPLRKRLIDAGRTFWSIARRDENGPSQLQQAADATKVQLLSRGSMPLTGVEEITEKLLLFVWAFSRLHGSRSPTVYEWLCVELAQGGLTLGTRS